MGDAVIGRAIAVAMLAAAAVTPAWADLKEDFQECVAQGQSLLNNDAAKVVAACSRLADAGNAEGEYHLGVLLENGQGMTQDYAAAARWYHAAAEQGLDPFTAQFGADAVEVRRDAALVAHVVARGDEERVPVGRVRGATTSLRYE